MLFLCSALLCCALPLHHLAMIYSTLPLRYITFTAQYYASPILYAAAPCRAYALRYFALLSSTFTVRCFTQPCHCPTILSFASPLRYCAMPMQDLTKHNLYITLLYFAFPIHCYTRPLRDFTGQSFAKPLRCQAFQHITLPMHYFALQRITYP
jgi:hypothetical protein